jgi:hypothetical protein
MNTDKKTKKNSRRNVLSASLINNRLLIANRPILQMNRVKEIPAIVRIMLRSKFTLSLSKRVRCAFAIACAIAEATGDT